MRPWGSLYTRLPTFLLCHSYVSRLAARGTARVLIGLRDARTSAFQAARLALGDSHSQFFLFIFLFVGFNLVVYLF